MPSALRPLSTGELLDRTFPLYRKNFLVFFGIAAIPQAVVLIILGTGVALIRSASKVRSDALVATTAIFGVLTLLIYLIGNLVATATTQAATTFAVSDLYLDKPAGIKSSYARVKGRVWRLVDVVFSVGLRIFIGFLLFFVPGILMLMRYSLAVPAAVLEKVKTREALKRSKQLSEGSGGRVLTVYVLMIVLIWAVSFGLTFASATFLRAGAQTNALAAQLVQQVISFLATSIASPVLTIALALLYYDQRVRKEAFDIEHMMTTLQAAPGTPSAAAGASA